MELLETCTIEHSFNLIMLSNLIVLQGQHIHPPQAEEAV